MIIPSTIVLSKSFTNPYDFTVDFHIAHTLPGNATQLALIISNREFLPDNDYTYERYVSKNGGRFFFIVSKVNDSIYLTPYNSIESALSLFSDDKSFLVFVNGHGKNFEHTILRGFELGERYNINPIMFDWPTEYYALRKTARNARKVSPNFALSVIEINKAFSKLNMNSNLSVMFHSMGNLIARNIVNKDYLDVLPENIFDNLILNAAAVRQRNHRNWVDKLDIQNRIYIVSNRNDFPLKGVMVLRLTTPLGIKYHGILSEKANYVDFSEIAGKEHNIFLGRTQVEKEHPGIYEFYFSLFNGKKVDLTNRNAFAKIHEGTEYFIF